MLEVCIDSLESALNAIEGGAEELEVCSSLQEGGLTPSVGLVKKIIDMVNDTKRELFQKPKVNVMLRCRTGSDFCFTSLEMETMIADLEIFKSLCVDRFVFGAITEDQEIHVDNCTRIIQLAGPIPVTFHRAFDVCKDPFLAMDKIVELGFDRLLTSGQKSSAVDHNAVLLIKDLINKYGKIIQIMPGAGVSVDNVTKFFEVGCKIVHSSCKKVRKLPNISNLTMGGAESDYIFVTDENIVKRMKELIKS